MKETRDILSLFEALNNHEVFTPPRVARAMLDTLPDTIWSDPHVTILDPCAKSGVFLREAFYRLYEKLYGQGCVLAKDGITYDLNNRQELINHILKNMLYGIATSELTGFVARRTLYGVMNASTDKQIAAVECFEKSANYQNWSESERLDFIGRNKFNEYYDHTLFRTNAYRGFESEGNIFFPSDEVKKKVLEDGNYEVEDTYFPFIESKTKHSRILHIRGGEMKFDVIIGNPPYQISDGGHGISAKPVYHHFVQQAIKLEPKYLVMVIPARWFSGGKGLDEFRKNMLTDSRIREIHDYPDATAIFPNVQIKGGICYFLWEKEYNGECKVNSYNREGLVSSMCRPLLEKSADSFIRYNQAITILHKVRPDLSSGSVSEYVSSRKPFGLTTTFRGKSVNSAGDIKVYQNGGIGWIEEEKILLNRGWINKYKVLVPRAGSGSDSFPHTILGRPFIAEPGSVCSETYLVAGTYDNPEEAGNLITYMKTRFFRFLVLLKKSTQDATSKVYKLVPVQDLKEPWSDEKLFKKYQLTKDEKDFIGSLIKSMD